MMVSVDKIMIRITKNQRISTSSNQLITLIFAPSLNLLTYKKRIVNENNRSGCRSSGRNMR